MLAALCSCCLCSCWPERRANNHRDVTRSGTQPVSAPASVSASASESSGVIVARRAVVRSSSDARAISSGADELELPGLMAGVTETQIEALEARGTTRERRNYVERSQSHVQGFLSF